MSGQGHFGNFTMKCGFRDILNTFQKKFLDTSLIYYHLFTVVSAERANSVSVFIVNVKLGLLTENQLPIQEGKSTILDLTFWGLHRLSTWVKARLMVWVTKGWAHLRHNVSIYFYQPATT